VSLVIEDVLVRNDPAGVRLPVVFDSPHSGRHYPDDFNFICPLLALRRAEDTFVEELYAAAPEYGATLLHALFPRSYIDVNRAIDDIDPDVVADWPGRARPTERSDAGYGLIRRLCRVDEPMYDGRLSAHVVMDRINRYYHPYHYQLARVIEDLWSRFGSVWHVDVHSMPSRGRSVDFVIGDRDGTTADPAFVEHISGHLTGLGYRVALNAPFKGVELIERHSDPARGRHCVQLEINRALFMDEDALEKRSGFDSVRRDITSLIRAIGAFAEDRVGLMAAE